MRENPTGTRNSRNRRTISSVVSSWFDADGRLLSPRASVDSIHFSFMAGALSFDRPATSLLRSMLNQIVFSLPRSRLPRWILTSQLAEWDGISHLELTQLDDALSSLSRYISAGTTEGIAGHSM